MVNSIKIGTVTRHATALSNVISCNAQLVYSVMSKNPVKREHMRQNFGLHIIINELISIR